VTVSGLWILGFFFGLDPWMDGSPRRATVHSVTVCHGMRVYDTICALKLWVKLFLFARTARVSLVYVGHRVRAEVQATRPLRVSRCGISGSKFR